MLHECSPVGAAPHIGSRRYMDGFMLHTGGVAGGSGQPPPLCRSTSCFVGPAARQKNVAYKAKRRRSRTKLAVRTSPGRTIRIAAALVSKRDHAEYAVRIIVGARCKEELVVCAVGPPSWPNCNAQISSTSIALPFASRSGPTN